MFRFLRHDEKYASCIELTLFWILHLSVTANVKTGLHLLVGIGLGSVEVEFGFAYWAPMPKKG